MTPPAISVVVATYNAEATLAETIGSVRRQTFSDFELLVVDDGSTDATLQLLDDLGDARLRVFRRPHQGVAAARNHGIAAASGEFVSFLDADDLWTPDKLELQLRALQQHPDAGLAYSWTALIDADGSFLFAKEPCREHGDVHHALIRECFIASASNVLVRKRCLDAVGGFDLELGAAQDWDLSLRIAARWPFALVPRYQVLYRIAESTMSADAARCERACLIVCERAFDRVPDLPPGRRREALANVKQYIAQLYLTRSTRADFRREAGRTLAEGIREYPRTLLAAKTMLLLWTCVLLAPVPPRLRRPAVRALLRCYGRWSVMTRRDVRELVGSLRSSPLGPASAPNTVPASRPG